MDERDPTDADLRRRDEIVSDLQRLVWERPAEARRGAQRLSHRINEYIARLNGAKKRSAEENLRLLRVAREIVLDRLAGPPAMQLDSGMRIDPGHPPPDFDPVGWNRDRSVPVWLKRAYEAVGRFDEDVNRQLWALVESLARVHTDTTADGRAGVDLRTVDAAHAYAFALWQRHQRNNHDGRQVPTLDEYRASLEPANATNFCATPFFAIGETIWSVTEGHRQRQLTNDECWDIALLTLIVRAPDFDPASVGLTGLPPWQADSPDRPMFSERRRILDAWPFRNREEKEELWSIAERACERLRRTAPTPSEPPPSEPPIARLLTGVSIAAGMCKQIADMAAKIDEMRHDRHQKVIGPLRFDSIEEAERWHDAIDAMLDKDPVNPQALTVCDQMIASAREGVALAKAALVDAAPAMNAALSPGSMRWSVDLQLDLDETQTSLFMLGKFLRGPRFIFRDWSAQLAAVSPRFRLRCGEVRAVIEQGLQVEGPPGTRTPSNESTSEPGASQGWKQAPATPDNSTRDGAQPRAVFRKLGGMWEIAFGGGKGLFPARKVMPWIAAILSRPHPQDASSAIDLVGGSREGSGRTRQPTLDPREREAIQEKLAEIEGHLNEARKSKDEPKTERLERERMAIAAQLRKDLQLGGNARALGPKSPEERAKETVGKAIKRFRDGLRSANPPLADLAEHLERFIMTEGTGFAYRPPSPAPDWAL